MKLQLLVFPISVITYYCYLMHILYWWQWSNVFDLLQWITNIIIIVILYLSFYNLNIFKGCIISISFWLSTYLIILNLLTKHNRVTLQKKVHSVVNIIYSDNPMLTLIPITKGGYKLKLNVIPNMHKNVYHNK